MSATGYIQHIKNKDYLSLFSTGVRRGGIPDVDDDDDDDAPSDRFRSGSSRPPAGGSRVAPPSPLPLNPPPPCCWAFFILDIPCVYGARSGRVAGRIRGAVLVALGFQARGGRGGHAMLYVALLGMVRAGCRVTAGVVVVFWPFEKRLAWDGIGTLDLCAPERGPGWEDHADYLLRAPS